MFEHILTVKPHGVTRWYLIRRASIPSILISFHHDRFVFVHFPQQIEITIGFYLTVIVMPQSDCLLQRTYCEASVSLTAVSIFRIGNATQNA